jgi:hypothetical protein
MIHYLFHHKTTKSVIRYKFQQFTNKYNFTKSKINYIQILLKYMGKPQYRVFVNNINSEKDLEQKEMRSPLDS